MLTIVVLFAFGSLCQADLPVTPQVICGNIPPKIYPCLGHPKLFTNDISAQCTKFTSECERMKCIFKKSGWMSGVEDAVDKSKVVAHFHQFAKDHPDWTPAVNYVKASCLSGNLPPQGWEVNCPAYDIVHCALTGFLKNAQPSQWSTAEECHQPRQFAAACPICPERCFAPAIPYGSCNACRLLPQTP